MSEGLVEEASMFVVSRGATKREVLMQATVVEVDNVVGDQDRYIGDEGMVNEEVECGEPTANKRGHAGCLDVGVVSGTCAIQKRPCRLPEKARRRCLK
jgi:hypothetical protein